MFIRDIRVENFRKFRDPVSLTGLGNGLNLICEPNETGKSTLLDAMRAALFERHSSKSERIRSFRPHGDEVAPTVDLVFEIDGVSWTLKKRFIDKASVSLEGGGNRFHGDEAEEKLQELLGFARAGKGGADEGALGLLWVEQGQSFVMGTPGQVARRTIEDVLAGEVGVVTGGKRTRAVVDAVNAGFAEFFTATGKPARKLVDAQSASTAASEAATTAEEELQQYENTLDRLESKRGELRRILRDIDDPSAAEISSTIAADIDRAKVAKTQFEKLSAEHRHAVQERDLAYGRLEQHRADVKALVAASIALDEAREAAETQASNVEKARQAEVTASTALDDVRNALAEAEGKRTRAADARRLAERQRAQAAAFERLDRVEAIVLELASLQSRIDAELMDADAAKRLAELEKKVVQTKAAVEAGATLLEINLTPSALGKVTIDGTAMRDDTKLAIDKVLTVVVPGSVELTLTPPASGEAAAAKWRAAEQDLANFLRGVGHGDIGAAHRGARIREDDLRDHRALSARLAAECPADPALGLAGGLDALRSGLSGEVRPSSTVADVATLDSDVGDAEKMASDLSAQHQEAIARREKAVEALNRALVQEARLDGSLRQADADFRRLTSVMGDEKSEDVETRLISSLAVADGSVARLTVDLDRAHLASDVLDLGALERKRENDERRRKQLQEDRVRLAGDIARLEGDAKTQGGSGPASRAAAAAELAEVAKQHLARVTADAEALRLLKETLDAAQADASQKYLTPITERIAPYLKQLLPNASLTFSEDFKPTLLTRGGRGEAAEGLSKGTQEQLAVLTRLAFADLLIAKGKPVSLVLDDALVFADDARFETMTEILREAANKMQVIVLSCRASAYRHVDAQRHEL